MFNKDEREFLIAAATAGSKNALKALEDEAARIIALEREDHPEEATTLLEAERLAIQNALDACDGNREQTAKRLGMGERTLYRKLKDYGLRSV